MGHAIQIDELHGLQVLKAFKRKEGELKVMDSLVKLAPRLLAQIIRMTKVDIPKRCHVWARTTVKTGIGLDAGVCLGWSDTEGYHMLGVSGKMGALVKIGGDLMAGLHRDRRRVKAIIGLMSVCVELIFEVKRKEEPEVVLLEDNDAVTAAIAAHAVE